MKVGLNQWMFPSDLAAVDCFRVAKEAGAHGVELNITLDKGELHLGQPLAYYKALSDSINEMGMEVASLLPAGVWGNFAQMSPSEIDEVCRRFEKLCDIAVILGTDTILMVPGNLADGAVRYDTAWENTTAVLRRMLPIATDKGIYLSIENVWNKFLLSPLEMKRYIDQFDSAHVQAYFDVGNIVLYGYPEHWIDILGARIRRVHLKDFRRSVASIHGFVGLLEGDVKWPSVVQALRRVGYDGYLTAELSRPAHGWQAFVRASCRIMHDLINTGNEVH